MEVINVMLVFEPDDHTALKSVIISDKPSVSFDAAWLHVYAIPVIFNHYFHRILAPLPSSPLPSPPPRRPSPSFYHQVIVIMNREMIGLRPGLPRVLFEKPARTMRSIFTTIHPIYFTFINTSFSLSLSPSSPPLPFPPLSINSTFTNL